MEINLIVDFFFDNCPYLGMTREQLAEDIKKHIEYGTIVVLKDEKGIVGATNFNLDGDTAHIINTAVRQDLRNQDVLVEMLKFGFKKFPHGKFLIFDRQKTGNKNIKIPIELILGKKE
jgi:hypothetical protein